MPAPFTLDLDEHADLAFWETPAPACPRCSEPMQRVPGPGLAGNHCPTCRFLAVDPAAADLLAALVRSGKR